MIDARRATPWVVTALLVAGMGGIGLRAYTRHEMQLRHGDSIWRLGYSVTFRAAKAGVKLHVAVPSDTPYARVFRQNLLYSGMSAYRLRPSRSQTREIGVSTLAPGQYTVTGRFDIHLSPRVQWRRNVPDGRPSAAARAAWLMSTPTIQVDSAVVQETAARLRESAANPSELTRRLFDHVTWETSATDADGDDAGPEDAAGTLNEKRGTPLGLARALLALFRAAKLPARLVTGFEIAGRSEPKPITWVEVLANGRWEAFDPNGGYAGELPPGYVPVRRDGDQIVRGANATQLEAEYTLVRLPLGQGMHRPGHRYPGQILDLTRLPLEMHEVLALILLMPLGALVTSIFRTMIGIDTFGTFTPTLLALSFVYADWRTGVLVFILCLSFGLASRQMLQQLKLLLVPRLSVILTLVVACIVFSISLLDYLQLTPSAQAVLLPLVILTMTIERFYVTTEEDGLRYALVRMTGTVAVAFCCYLVLRWAEVGNLLVAFPEIHFVTLAILIAMGRYTGYRLTELWRFRDLAGPQF